MIQPNELRIGNLLEWEDDSHSTVVLTGVIAYPDDVPAVVYYNELDGSDHGSAMLYEFIPIPLSEDWLERFGFEPNGVFKSMKILLPNSEHESKTYIVVTFDEEAWIQIEQERKEILGDRELTRTKEMQSGTFRCAYVHQLQNLFHSLTGEELTLSE